MKGGTQGAYRVGSKGWEPMTQLGDGPKSWASSGASRVWGLGLGLGGGGGGPQHSQHSSTLGACRRRGCGCSAKEHVASSWM